MMYYGRSGIPGDIWILNMAQVEDQLPETRSESVVSARTFIIVAVCEPISMIMLFFGLDWWRGVSNREVVIVACEHLCLCAWLNSHVRAVSLIDGALNAFGHPGRSTHFDTTFAVDYRGNGPISVPDKTQWWSKSCGSGRATDLTHHICLLGTRGQVGAEYMPALSLFITAHLAR